MRLGRGATLGLSLTGWGLPGCVGGRVGTKRPRGLGCQGSERLSDGEQTPFGRLCYPRDQPGCGWAGSDEMVANTPLGQCWGPAAEPEAVPRAWGAKGSPSLPSLRHSGPSPGSVWKGTWACLGGPPAHTPG